MISLLNVLVTRNVAKALTILNGQTSVQPQRPQPIRNRRNTDSLQRSRTIGHRRRQTIGFQVAQNQRRQSVGIRVNTMRAIPAIQRCQSVSIQANILNPIEQRRQSVNVATQTNVPNLIEQRRQSVSVATQTNIPNLIEQRQDSTVTQHSTIEEEVWCICRKKDDGRKMIFCENPRCVIKWFHLNCMDITAVPKGAWYCNNCTQIMKKHA